MEISTNFLKKLLNRNKPTYTAQNRLETLLQEAASDPGARPGFLKQLFHFDLLTLGEMETQPDGVHTALFKSHKTQDGAPYVMSFTSEKALSFFLEKNKLPPQEYVGMKAQDLFEMIQHSAGVYLNPTLPFGKFFYQREFSELLNDSPSTSKIKVSKSGEAIFIGIPKEIPKDFLVALKSYIQRTPCIKDGYFGLHACDGGRTLAYRVAVEFDEAQTQSAAEIIFNEIGMIARDLNLDKPLDLLIASDEDRSLVAKRSLISVVRFGG